MGTELANNFELMKQSLVAEGKNGKAELAAAKKGIAVATEKKSKGEGDLQVTQLDLKEDIKTKSALHHDCKSKAQAFEMEAKSRTEELKALATAKKLIQEATSLTQVSFVQVKAITSTSYNVVRFVRNLAHKQNSNALSLLAQNLASALHSSDPFSKVKGMITEMITKLEDAGAQAAQKKEYCDKQMSETKEKKEDKTDAIHSEPSKSDKAHASGDGAASGIISLLEVCEADFSKNLAGITFDEERAISEYEKVTKENQIDKVTKAKDIKYKSKQAKGLDKSSAELKGDRNGVTAELDAVSSYLRRIEDECIAKAETYEERTKRREAELAGLQEALKILESEEALIQTSRRIRRNIRGTVLSA